MIKIYSEKDLYKPVVQFATPIKSDPFESDVVCRINFHDFPAVDDSQFRQTITSKGSVGYSIDRANKKYGRGAGYFPNPNGWLTVSLNPSAILGTNPFTIEFWTQRPVSGSYQGFLQFTPTEDLSIVNYERLSIVFQSTLNFFGNAGNGTIDKGSWSHFAAVREGTGTNQFKIYKNGVLVSTGTLATDFTQGFVQLGAYYSNTYCWGGVVDCFRITKLARYTSDFDPESDTYLKH